MTGSKAIAAMTVSGMVQMLPGTALAAPEEIQVYRNELEEPGHFGLDVHTSYVLTGNRAAEEQGLESSIHRLRVTPEFAYALSETLELGAYLPLTTLQTDTGRFKVEGAKLRLKYIAPRAEDQDWYWGLNGEFGRVDAALDPNPYNAELKAIVGRQTGNWSLAANLNIDVKVHGPQSAPTTLELATKLEYKLGEDAGIGIENYNGLGEWKHLGRFSRSEHQSFVTVSRKLGGFDVDLGVGTGYGANSDHFLVRAIIGVPL
jgi:hypothetical protein